MVKELFSFLLNSKGYLDVDVFTLYDHNKNGNHLFSN